MLTLGTLTLDDNPYVAIGYKYNTTSNGTIVGGTKSITLTGSIVSSDPSVLMSKAKELNDWFNQTPDRTINSVTINNVNYAYVIIESVSIDEGDWVNKISYTIGLRTPLENSAVLPTNIFGLSYTDNVKTLEISESINIESDKNNTFYVTNTGLSTINGSVRWDIKISVSCLKDNNNSAIKNAETILRNILITSPDRAEFDEYKNWNMFLQSRSLAANPSNGSLEFSLSVLLVPISITNDCLVNFSHTYNHNYINNSHTRTLSIDIEGLVSINWSDIIDLASSCITGKYQNADNFASLLATQYKDPTSHSTIDLILNELECDISCNLNESSLCWSPRNITMAGSIVDGTANVSMEWASDANNCGNNGISTEVALVSSNTKLAIHVQNAWDVGYPIIQNLNCNYPNTKDYTITAKSRYQCPTSATKSAAESAANEIIASLPVTWYKIKDTRTQDNTSYTIRMSWIEVCP